MSCGNQVQRRTLTRKSCATLGMSPPLKMGRTVQDQCEDGTGGYVEGGVWPQTTLSRCRFLNLVCHIWPVSSTHTSPPRQSPQHLTDSCLVSLLHTVSLGFLKLFHCARQGFKAGQQTTARGPCPPRHLFLCCP